MSDLLFKLESHLDAGQNRAVAEMQRLATAAGMNVWLTGGAMRDLLRGAPTRDLDFTVERDAVRLGKALAEALPGGEVLLEDPLKRSVELEFAGPVRASVSNSRTEKYSRPGGKPHIAPATIHEDLKRRDFTINAIGLALNRGSRGLLIDPSNGQADIENRELRSASSGVFFDDPARIFRLLRLQHTLGFTVAARTQSQLENALLEEYQNLASAEQLAAEIRVAAMHPAAVALMADLEKYKLLDAISPALHGSKMNTAGLTKLATIAEADLPAGTPGGWLAFLHILLEKLNERERAAALKPFALTPGELAAWNKLDGQTTKLETLLKSPKTNRPGHVWQALEGATADEILMVLYRPPARVVHDRIRAWYEKYLPIAQEVTDEEVAAASGSKPGTPKFQKARRALIVAKLNARPRKVAEEEQGAPEAVLPGPPGARIPVGLHVPGTPVARP